MDNKSKRGGARLNAGRKPSDNKRTPVRIRMSEDEEKEVRNLLEKMRMCKCEYYISPSGERTKTRKCKSCMYENI